MRRLKSFLIGMALAPPAAAAVWAWWTRGLPRTPGDAATWTAAHEGDLDATGLFGGYEHDERRAR